MSNETLTVKTLVELISEKNPAEIQELKKFISVVADKINRAGLSEKQFQQRVKLKRTDLKKTIKIFKTN